ncbi:hypothetical protein HMPREF1584_01437 [Gardnerella vaginalis JCP8481A]|nr:hypothetical protein HMPREF1584_01437 [Gardnerella vaginalis JCP8481A]EPI44768.1 hypothetical protein HMPREF1585_00004 [Gardnerella vaginalis JCP8481B]
MFIQLTAIHTIVSIKYGYCVYEHAFVYEYQWHVYIGIGICVAISRA